MVVKELVAAVQADDFAQVRAILDARPEVVNLDLAENDEHQALHYAVLRRSPDMVRLLMQYGANPHRGIYPHRQATTALTIATERGYSEIVEIILGEEARRPPESQEVVTEEERKSDSRDAVARGDNAWLLARHAEGKLTNPIHQNGGLLTTAVLHGQIQTLRLLLDLGLDPDERVRVGGLEQVVYSQSMPLWNCAATGRLDMAELLLERGANPNVHYYASGTPVYSAYRSKDSAMLELLKRYGGVVDPVTLGLFHEKELAQQMLADEVAGRVQAGILEGRNVSEDLLRGAADSGDTAILRMALPGVDWLRDDDRWFWILMQAVWSPSPECFGLILQRCDATLRHPRFGRTILHDVAALGREATAEASPAFAEMLLDAGANIHERDDILKSTPLGWACRWGRVPLVEFLLRRGADPVEADAEPWATPRAWAEKRGNTEVLRLLR